jgi:transposase
MPQNFVCPQRDQPLLMPLDMRDWLPEDDLVFVVLDAVATLDLGEFRRRYRADGHGRAAFGPEMMVALLLYGYCQGERSSRVTGKRCVRDVGYRVIAGGLRPDHATIARFRARHEQALGGLFSQVLRLLAAEGMVSLGTLSLEGTKLAGNAAQKANRTLPQTGKVLAEAAGADAAEDAREGGSPPPATPRTLARRAERRERLARARDRLAAEDKARRDEQRAKQEAWDAAAAAGKRRGRRPAAEPPRANRAGTEPRANTTDPDVRVMRNQKGYVAGYNGQLVVTAGQVIAGAMLSRHPGRPHPAAPPPGHLPRAADRGRYPPGAAHRACRLRLRQRGQLRPRRRRWPAAPRAAGQGPGQGPGPAPRPCSPKDQAPRRVSGHRPRHPAPATSPRPGGLQAAGPHGGTGVRATQDLPGTDHDVPARPDRMRKRMAARLRRAQSAQAAPAPRRRATIKGHLSGSQDLRNARHRHPAPRTCVPSPPTRSSARFVRQAESSSLGRPTAGRSAGQAALAPRGIPGRAMVNHQLHARPVAHPAWLDRAGTSRRRCRCPDCQRHRQAGCRDVNVYRDLR